MATTIYLKKDTEAMIQRIRERQHDFNLSEFIRKTLEMEETGKSESQEELILGKIKEIELQRIAIEKNLEFYKEKLDNYYKEKQVIAEKAEQKRKQKEQEQEGHEKERKRKAIAYKKIKEYFAKEGNAVFVKGRNEGKWKTNLEFYEKYLNKSKDSE